MNRSALIAILAPKDVECFRGVIRGINSYYAARSNSPYLPMTDIIMPLNPGWKEYLQQWDPVGLIAHVLPETIDHVRDFGKPFVQILGNHSDGKIPAVDVDNVAVGHVAAEHFLDRGFKHYVFVGEAGAQYAMLREQGFREGLARMGITPLSPIFLPHETGARDWMINDELLRQHLAKLPRPLAVFAANDFSAAEVARVCVRNNIAIPDDIALLGADNDDVLCCTWRPAVSSIKLPFERIGYEAAQLIEKMLKGKPVQKKTILLPPLGVVTRPSSDILAIDHPDVATAVRYIRENVGKAVGVKDLLREVMVSRRALERSFREVLNRSPHQEIRRVQLETAKRLLAETDLPMSDVAASSGFSDSTYLSIVFHQQMGMTPSAYRKEAKPPK